MDYTIFKGTVKMNGKVLRIGEQLRIDLNGCTLADVKELKGLQIKEVTEGHTDGDYTRKYIEIVSVDTPKTLKTLIKRVKEDIIESYGNLNDCKECSVIELCNDRMLDVIATFSKGLNVTNREYNILTCELYGSHSHCNTMEDLKRELLMDVIDLALVGKETTFIKYKKSLMEDI